MLFSTPLYSGLSFDLSPVCIFNRLNVEGQQVKNSPGGVFCKNRPNGCINGEDPYFSSNFNAFFCFYQASCQMVHGGIALQAETLQYCKIHDFCVENFAAAPEVGCFGNVCNL